MDSEFLYHKMELLISANALLRQRLDICESDKEMDKRNLDTCQRTITQLEEQITFLNKEVGRLSALLSTKKRTTTPGSSNANELLGEFAASHEAKEKRATQKRKVSTLLS